ncbi:unnamed protein product, partial [Pylaiella littoralis]
DTAAAEWTYRATSTSGEEPYGPSDWSKGYPDCAMNRQSPINLATDLMTMGNYSDYGLEFNRVFCRSSELTFQADYAVYFDGCPNVPSLTWEGETYNLLQFHIHSPSEHLMGYGEHDAEIHMVHVKEGTTDELLVVGILYDVSQYGNNVGLERLWNVLELGGNSTTETFNMAVYDVLPDDPSYSHYMGSLTTPPCTQGVKWIVMNEVSTMGKGQLEDYREAVASYPGSKVDEFGNTNRPAQTPNGRDVFYIA